MSKLKGAHKSKKAQATAYKMLTKAGKNKLAKLQKHLKKHPGDVQASGAVKTARTYEGRTEPKRTGARINYNVGDRDMIALAENLIELKQATRESCIIKDRSLNLRSGRISALGLRVQAAAARRRAAMNEAQFDRKGKRFPKPKLTKAERDLAKARALGKQEGASKAQDKRQKHAGKSKAATKAATKAA